MDVMTFGVIDFADVAVLVPPPDFEGLVHVAVVIVVQHQKDFFQNRLLVHHYNAIVPLVNLVQLQPIHVTLRFVLKVEPL